jgi:CheY-like chemotaxis protein
MPWVVLLIALRLFHTTAYLSCEANDFVVGGRVEFEALSAPSKTIGIDDLLIGRYDDSFDSVEIGPGGGFRLTVPAGRDTRWLRGRYASAFAAAGDALLIGCVRGRISMTVFLPDDSAKRDYQRSRQPFGGADLFGGSPGTPSADWVGIFGTAGTPGFIGPVVEIPLESTREQEFYLKIETPGFRHQNIDFLVFSRSWLTRYGVTRRRLWWGYLGVVLLSASIGLYLLAGKRTGGGPIPPAARILGGFVVAVLFHRFVQYLVVPMIGQELTVLQTALRWLQCLLFLRLAVHGLNRARESGRNTENVLVKNAGSAGTILIIAMAIPNIMLEPLRTLTYVDDVAVIGVIAGLILTLSILGIRKGNGTGWFTGGAASLVIAASITSGFLRMESAPGALLAMSVLPLVGDVGLIVLLGAPTLGLSRLSKGSRVLPEPGVDGEKQGVRPPPTDEGRGRTRPVLLVVDDIPVNRRVVVHYCVLLDIPVDEADSAAAAVAACRRNEYDLILMDLGLPDFDGVEAVRRIRAFGGPNADTPVIGVTAGGTFDSLHPGGLTGLAEYIYKPFRVDDLRRLIDRWCPGYTLPE